MPTRAIAMSAIWLAMAMLIVGCARQKEPATKALAQAEAAIASVRDDANRYAPGDLQGIEATHAALKANLANGDYKAVLAGAPQLMSAVDSLKTSVAARKAEAEAAAEAASGEWNALAEDVPKMVQAIQSRVDTLSASRKLPKNVSQGSFDQAKSGLDMMKTTWAEASSEYSAGDPVNAVAKAKQVQEKGAEVLKLLGMS
jgi:hypothetical protein